MKRKILIIVLCLFMCNHVNAEQVLNGFVDKDGFNYYYVDGIFQTGVLEIDNSYYYFDNEGKMKKNTWLDYDLDGKYDYYFGNDGKIVDGVQEIDGYYYYFIDNKKQYQETDGTYYYGRLTGTRQYNYWWDQDKDGKNDYYFGSDGKIVDGVQEIDGYYYYFVNNKKQYQVTDGTYYYGRLTGARQYNYYWSKKFDGIINCYFGSDGKIVKNTWMDYDLDGNYDYYFDSNYEASNGVQEIDGVYYYFVDNKKQYQATDGTYYYGRLTGTRQYNYWWDQDKDGKNDYYFGSDGKIVDGVQEIAGNHYYFIDNKKQYQVTDGTYYYGRLTGTRQYNYWWDQDKDGKYDYYFGSDGVLIKGEWYDYDLDGKDDYYFDVTGKYLDGVQEIDGYYYYFIDYKKQYEATDGTYYYGRLTGTRQYNYWWDQDKDGKYDYYFGSDGKMVFGSQFIDGNYYYFDNFGKKQYDVFVEIDGKTYYYGKNSGTRQYGWITNSSNTYYFDNSSGEMAVGDVIIDGVAYKFADNGVWQAGWVSKNNKRYYYYLDGTMATGWVYIAGLKCYFNNNGELVQEGALKVIDVSVHQGNIDWNIVANNTDVDGAIVRLGYGTSYVTDSPVVDSYFNTNYDSAVNNDLLFGVYIYSYAIDVTSARIEADFVINLLNSKQFDKNKIVYYDLESNAWTANLSSSDYDNIISTFINRLANAGYKVQLYTYKYLAETKFSNYAKSQLGWIAQYANNCTYNGNYFGWQYTDSGSVLGINGNVDISVWKK